MSAHHRRGAGAAISYLWITLINDTPQIGIWICYYRLNKRSCEAQRAALPMPLCAAAPLLDLAKQAASGLGASTERALTSQAAACKGSQDALKLAVLGRAAQRQGLSFMLCACAGLGPGCAALL